MICGAQGNMPVNDWPIPAACCAAKVAMVLSLPPFLGYLGTRRLS